MFSVLKYTKLQKCHHDTLPLIKINGIINDTIDIKKDRGDIPISCSQKEFNNFLDYLEVITIKTERNEPIIQRQIVNYNSEKLYKLKQKL